jgi:serine/threonine protein kinase/tetratricopeptide (TPR) repeat protein
MPEHQPQVDDVFDEALRRAAGPDRAHYLDEACASDPEMRRRVERLLRAISEAGSFLEAPARDPSPTVDQLPVETPGTVIGPYKLLEQIGEGGMGTVWMAQQTEPVKRVVAIKLIKIGMDSRQVIARFEAERQALALMDHPNIARVLDGGTTSTGRPYFVMDLVKGVPITKYCDEHHLTPRQRLELFVPVCQAVQHAHQKGIIHRDLKPSNVLVALYDGRPVPKVIDFGVAKAAGQPLTEKTLVTGFGAIIGTLEYMSPEQAEINQLDVDTRSDIYSLGVLLYELLAGSPPFSRKELEKAGMLEMLRLIREQEPSKPSTKLSTAEGLPTLAANRGTEPAKLTKLVRGELDWIVMKALEKDRNRRYETANDFAADVLHYLNDEHVQACPPSVAYRFGKFARRNHVALLTASLVSIVMVLGTAISAWQAVRATHAEHVAQVARLDESKQRDLAESRQKDADDARAEAETQRAVAEANFQKARKTVDEYFTLVSENTLLDVPGLQPLRKELLEGALRFYEQTAADRANDPAVLADLAITRLRLAHIYLMLDRLNDSIPANQRALDIVDRLLAEYPDATDQHRTLAGFWTGWRSVTLHPVVRDKEGAFQMLLRFEKTWSQLVSRYPNDPAFQRDLAGIDSQIGGLWELMGRPTETITSLRKGRAILQQLIREHHSVAQYRADMESLLQGLVRALVGNGEKDEALTLITEATELSEELVAEFPKNSTYRSELSYCLRRLGSLVAGKQPQTAENHYRRAMEVAESLVRESPANVIFRHTYTEANASLSQQAKANGNSAVVEETLRSRIRIQEMLAAYEVDNDGHRIALISTLRALARHLERDPARSAEAEELNRRALATLTEISRVPAADPRRLIRFASQLGSLSDADCPDPTFRIDVLSRAVTAGQKLMTEHPEELEYRLKLVFIRRELAQRLRGFKDRLGDAEKLHQEALADLILLAKQFPDDPQHVEQAGHTYRYLGWILRDAGRPEDAIDSFEKGVAAFQKLGDASDSGKKAYYRGFQSDTALQLGHALWQLADQLAAAKRHDDSETTLRRAQNLFEKLVADFPNQPLYRVEQGFTHWKFGGLLSNLGRHAEAEAAYRQALAAYETLVADYPENYEYHLRLSQSFIRLAESFERQGKHADKAHEQDKAAAQYTKAIDLKPDASEAWSGRAIIHFNRQQWDEAIACYQKAIELDPKYAGAHNDFAWLLATCSEAKFRDAKRAVELAKRAVELKPQEGNYWNTLGVAHYRAGSWKDAVAGLEKSMELGKGGDAYDWFFLAMAHGQLGDKADARRWYDKSVEWMDKKQPENEELRRFRVEAAELLGVAVEVDPAPRQK